jgi:small subunit ribosomal protein S30e
MGFPLFLLLSVLFHLVCFSFQWESCLSFFPICLFASPPPFYAGKVHGALSRAGKVRDHTPKVAKTATHKKATGRNKIRQLYKKRFLNVVAGPRKEGPNKQKTKGANANLL